MFLTYLLAPLTTTFLVTLFKIPTFFIKRAIFQKAKGKIVRTKKLIVIGITGSYGKSSTKEFLAQILAKKFKVMRTPENVNSEIGVAKFILNNLSHRKNQYIDLRSQYIEKSEVFIVEMGAYKIGEIKRICEIVKPKIGILTGINEQHLGLFGSLENIKKAKFELIESLPPNGLAVFNGENKYVAEMAGKWEGKKIIYTTKYEMNTKIRNYEKFPKHYLLNLAGAIEVAKYLGMVDEEIEKAIREIDFTAKTFKIYTGKNKVLIIDDTYSANPDGVLAALDYLGSRLESTKIVIMPCLIELGEAASAVHQKIGRKIKDISDFAIIITPDYFRDIKKEAGDKALLMKNSGRIGDFLKNKLNSNTVILLEGRIPQNIIDIVK
jgi:UDP-N-acetylmuramoyl-tripeptide--D-alanyl-D-alanine ligase